VPRRGIARERPAGRKVFYERMGDPSTPSGKVQLERQSPLNSAAKITTPLLVIPKTVVLKK
jgi:hypothetical protein